VVAPDDRIHDRSVPARDRLIDCLRQVLALAGVGDQARAGWSEIFQTFIEPEPTDENRAPYLAVEREAHRRVEYWLTVLSNEGALADGDNRRRARFLVTVLNGLSVARDLPAEESILATETRRCTQPSTTSSVADPDVRASAARLAARPWIAAGRVGAAQPDPVRGARSRSVGSVEPALPRVRCSAYAVGGCAGHSWAEQDRFRRRGGPAVRLSFRLRGRASRPEFWYFFLAYVPLVLVFGASAGSSCSRSGVGGAGLGKTGSAHRRGDAASAGRHGIS
jgi:hypothetical protein